MMWISQRYMGWCFLACAGLLGMLVGCQGDKQGSPGAAPASAAPSAPGLNHEVSLHPKALKEVKIEIRQVRVLQHATSQITAVGRVVVPIAKISRVGSRVEGRIVRWYVHVGQKVKRGKALALIDSPVVGRARASYLSAHAMFRLAQIEHQRTKRLKGIGLVSSRQLLAASMAFERARIRLYAAQAHLRILGISRPPKKGLRSISGRFVLPAPSSGEVTRIHQTHGAWVTPQVTVMQIEDRRNTRILLELHARDVPFVKVGQSVLIRGPGLLQPLKGKIEHIPGRFGANAQTMEVRVALDAGQAMLRTNQFVYAAIHARASQKDPVRPHVILIPQSAIQRVPKGKIVFVAGSKPGFYRVRHVVAVGASGGNVRILHGLKGGERVVVKGAFVLKSELMRAMLDGGGE